MCVPLSVTVDGVMLEWQSQMSKDLTILLSGGQGISTTQNEPLAQIFTYLLTYLK